MSFEFVVLGASGTFPTADGASTGFLLRSGEANVWLDAGTGTFANLQRHADFFGLRALVLSHLHLDHCLDLFPFYYGLRYSPNSPGPIGLEVLAPNGAEAHLARLLDPEDKQSFDGYLKFRSVKPGDSISLGPFDFTFIRAAHPVETLAMVVEVEGRRLAYTSDSGPSDEMAGAFKGADLLLCEATLQSPMDASEPVHMTAEEAGEMADRAGVDRLVLTHISPGLDTELSRTRAASRFSGEIILARDNLAIEV